MAIKIINPRTLISSIEELSIKAYIHDGTYTPILGSTTSGYKLFGETGFIDSGSLIENTDVTGLYEADIELNLAESLPAGNYFVVIFDASTTKQILNENITSQITDLSSEISLVYGFSVDLFGNITNDPADLILNISPGSGILAGTPAISTVEGDTGLITLDYPSSLIVENQDFSSSLNGDPLNFSTEYSVAFPPIIKPDGSDIASSPSDIVVTFSLGSGSFISASQTTNSIIDDTGITFSALDLIIQETYSFSYDGFSTSVTIPANIASYLIKPGTGNLADSPSDVSIINTTTNTTIVADSVDGALRLIDWSSSSPIGNIGDDITITFYRLPDNTLASPDSLTISYYRLPSTTAGDTVTVTYNIPGTIEVLSIEKGGDLAAAEFLLEENQQREFVIAQDKIVDRNVVAGGVEGFIIKTKNFTDPDFSNPVTEKKINFTYKEMSPQSDIILTEPED